MSLLNDGGPLFMYPLLFMLLLVIVLVIKGFIKSGSSEKTIKLISSIALFALVWGFFGQVIGLIEAFDIIEMNGAVSFEILAGGLKISFLTTAFGLFIFLAGRLGIIILTWMAKE